MKHALRARLLMLASLPAAALTTLAHDAIPVPPASPSGFTGNLTLSCAYLYRGIAQRNGKPALQGGFDHAHAGLPLYAGIWGSTISWLADQRPGVSAPLELDTYAGYGNSFARSDWDHDVGVLTYKYPGTYPSGFTRPDTTEIYAAIRRKDLEEVIRVRTGEAGGEAL